MSDEETKMQQAQRVAESERKHVSRNDDPYLEPVICTEDRAYSAAMFRALAVAIESGQVVGVAFATVNAPSEFYWSKTRGFFLAPNITGTFARAATRILQDETTRLAGFFACCDLSDLPSEPSPPPREEMS